MASPQVENGHTRIANALLEAAIKAPLTVRELRLFMALIRKIYGWRKTCANISKAELSRLTGIDRKSLYKPLANLIAKNMVEVRTNSGPFECYSIQKDFDKWQKTGPRGHEKKRGDGATPSGVTGPRKNGVTGPHLKRNKEKRKKGAGANYQPSKVEFDALRKKIKQGRPL